MYYVLQNLPVGNGWHWHAGAVVSVIPLLSPLHQVRENTVHCGRSRFQNWGDKDRRPQHKLSISERRWRESQAEKVALVFTLRTTSFQHRTESPTHVSASRAP